MTQKKQITKRTFICNILPSDYIIKSKASQAAINFCNRLVDGKCFNDIRSITPISYQLPPQITYKNITFYINNGKNSHNKIVRYILLNVKLARDTHTSDAIWFYNLTFSCLLAYTLLKFIWRKKIYIIMADYTPSSNIFSLQSFIGWLLRKCDGMISLSARSCFKHIKNLKVKAGIIDENMLNIKSEKKDINDIIFLFSGTLSPVTGYDMALKVFSKIPNAQLYISGNGEFPTEYKKYTNLHFFGNMKYEDYLCLLDSATICLNLRNPNLPENNNNFPSKVLDYFSKGKIVLSTISYPEIKGANYILSEYNEAAITKSIQDIINMDINELLKYSDNISFLRMNFTVQAWKETIHAVDSLNI